MARLKNFRLQKVLEFKEHLEALGTLEMHKAKARQNEAEQVLGQLQHSKEQLLQQASEQLQQHTQIDLNELKIKLSYLDQLHNSIENQYKNIENLKSVVEQKRAELNNAVKERKILETLKDHFQANQKHDIQKAEMEKIDEIAIRKKPSSEESGE